MDQNASYWQDDLPSPGDEGHTLARLLTALDAGPAGLGFTRLAGDSLLGGTASGVAAEAIRNLTAIFNEQVAQVAHLMDAALCTLYLAEPYQPDISPQRGQRRPGRETRPLEYASRRLLSLRAVFGAPWNDDATRRGMPAPLDGPAMQTLLDQSPLLSEVADMPVLKEWAAARNVHGWLYVPLFGTPSPQIDQQNRPSLARRMLHEYNDWPAIQQVALGVLAVGRDDLSLEFSEEDVHLLRVLGEKLVLTLENARLNEQANLGRELARHYGELQRGEAEHEQILEELGEGLMVLSLTGQILRLNAVGRELLGWPGLAGSFGDLGRLQDYEALQMRDALDRPLLIEEWPMFRALRGEEFQQVEVRYFSPHSAERFLFFSGRPLRDEQGNVQQALLTFHEATREQMALAQLEQMVRLADQRAHYVGAVLEAMTDGLLVCNSAGVLLHVNTAGSRLLGIEQRRLLTNFYSLEQLLSDFQVRVPAGQPMPAEAFPLARALRGETVRNVEIVLCNPDAREDWQAAMSASPIRDRAGNARILGAVAVLVDVTRARELERAKDEFLAVAAHELNTPITSIRGFAQLLQRGAKQAPEGRERRADMQMVDKILNQTERLTSQVGELTDAARADLGKLELRQRPVALGSLLRRVAEAQQVTTEQHKVQLDTPALVLIVRGDERRLDQVFSNLVANAIKYSPAGGEITITVKDLEAQGCVEITVRDQGQGIASSDLERIFSRFTRADPARNSKMQGLGLGLYIARFIIEAHKGTITAESEGIGKGSAFIVRLPRSGS